MIQKTIDKVCQYMLDYHMPVKNSHVIIGVSGGADSMCLLFVMLQLRKRLNMTVTAVHINHGLRGDEADADQAFTEHFCKLHGIECVTFHTDIRALADKEKISEEEAGRKYRYTCFEQVKNEYHADCIAVAHHQDDQAETVLFNLARGSGLSGLSGIAPVRDDIIRPLLCLNRREIEAVLKAVDIDFQTDRTNFDTNYTRNKLRHKVIPYMVSEINSETVAHISKTAINVRMALEYIQKQAEDALEHIRVNTEDDTYSGDSALIDDPGENKNQNAICCRLFLEYPEILQKEMLRQWLWKHTGSLKDITEKHLDAMIELVHHQSGRRINLPYGWIVVKTGENLRLVHAISKKISDQNQTVIYDITHIPCEIKITPDTTVTFDILLNEENIRIPENTCTKWMDYDKIKGSLKIRHRQSSDVMSIMGGKHKKLRRVMIDDKIPEDRREQIWLLADENDILCILGGRMGEDYKVTKETRTILIVGIKKDNKGENQWKTKSEYLSVKKK